MIFIPISFRTILTFTVTLFLLINKGLHSAGIQKEDLCPPVPSIGNITVKIADKEAGEVPHTTGISLTAPDKLTSHEIEWACNNGAIFDILPIEIIAKIVDYLFPQLPTEAGAYIPPTYLKNFLNFTTISKIMRKSAPLPLPLRRHFLTKMEWADGPTQLLDNFLFNSMFVRGLRLILENFNSSYKTSLEDVFTLAMNINTIVRKPSSENSCLASQFLRLCCSVNDYYKAYYSQRPGTEGASNPTLLNLLDNIGWTAPIASKFISSLPAWLGSFLSHLQLLPTTQNENISTRGNNENSSSRNIPLHRWESPVALYEQILNSSGCSPEDYQENPYSRCLIEQELRSMDQAYQNLSAFNPYIPQRKHCLKQLLLKGLYLFTSDIRKLANQYFRAKNNRKAFELFALIADQSDCLLDDLEDLAEITLFLKEYSEHIKWQEKVASYRELDANELGTMGLCSFKIHNYEDAVRYTGKAAASPGGTIEHLRSAAKYASRISKEKQIHWLKRVQKHVKHTTKDTRELAAAYFNLEKYAKSEKYCIEATQSSDAPTTDEYYITLYKSQIPKKSYIWY